MRYIAALDGIRAFAVLSVMAYHTGHPIAQGGMIGVDVFFVLSGFLITSILVSEYDRRHGISLKAFYLRRLLRLAPPLLLMLSVFVMLSTWLDPDPQSRYEEAAIAAAYLTNWARMTENFQPAFLAHCWSLAVEEQFYLLWPLVLIVTLRYARQYAAWAAIGIAIASWLTYFALADDQTRVYNGLDTRAHGLMVGCAIAFLRVHLPRFLGPLALAGLCVIAMMDWTGTYRFAVCLMLTEILAAVLILDVVRDGSYLRRLLSMRAVVWVGTISYGLYLWHWPIYRLMFQFEATGWQVVVFGAGGAFVAATLSRYLLELPMLRMKDRVSSRVEVSPVAGK
jgi:peptidoglycan/LPS O-acetylase OafA/YrhL